MQRPWLDPDGREFAWGFHCAHCGTVYIYDEPFTDPDQETIERVMVEHAETMHPEGGPYTFDDVRPKAPELDGYGAEAEEAAGLVGHPMHEAAGAEARARMRGLM